MSELVFHFLNVGKGNCIIIDFPSRRLTVIDIDDSRAVSANERTLMEKAGKARLTNPIDYITSQFRNREIFRFILTHPDMDHMSGIKKLFGRKVILNFWDTDNNKYIDPDTWENSLYDKEDWDFYQRKRKSNDNPRVLRLYRDEIGNYWSDDGIEILAPTKELVEETNKSKSEDYDGVSYVLMVKYSGKKVLLGGDATIKVWEDIIERYGPNYIKSDVLLAPGHGSNSHISKEILDAITPALTIVSVAEGVDYAYHLYSQYGIVLSTRYYGNIWVGILNNGEIYFSTQFQKYSGEWFSLTDELSNLLARRWLTS